MVSKNQIKLIISLHQKKFRNLHKMFFVEGEKGIRELLNSNFQLEQIYSIIPVFDEIEDNKFTLISESELKKISALVTPNTCLAIFKIPEPKEYQEKGLVVALDSIRDPGNLGTIIRLCDWFGLAQLVCSPKTVDVYNPKVVQATMGSLARVNIQYVDLEDFISKSKLPVFGTFMDGQTIYKSNLPKEGIIIMGNEANGISETIEKKVTNRISIPRFGDFQQTESLNVATATAIVLSEFKRNG